MMGMKFISHCFNLFFSFKNEFKHFFLSLLAIHVISSVIMILIF